MRLRGTVIGALNLFHLEPGEMGGADVEAAKASADVATIAILQHRALFEAQVVNQQRQHVVNSRVIIEQAKGMVAEREGLDMDQAFTALRNHARNHNLRLVDFKNTVIIMTSNLGTADLRKTSVGFAKTDEAVTHENMKVKVNDALKQHFRPEFLNRIDDVIVFHELSKDEVTVIIDLMMQRVRGQLEAQGLSIELTRPAKYLVVEKGYDPTMGARPLRRALQRMVEDPLSERILSKEFSAGDTIIVDADNGEVTFRVMEHFEPPPVELAGAVSSD